MACAEEARPLVSVLLAVRNEAATIASCLESLEGQQYPAGWIEVIVADGGSEDGTIASIRDFARRAPFPVQLVDNAQHSAAGGFNAALRAARGEVIVILGARARPTPRFLSASIAALDESGADAVGGIVHARAAGRQAEALALALGSPFGVGDARYRYSGRAGSVDTVNYGAYRREVFQHLGGFDETMDNVEDDEFNYRLRSRGGRLYLSPAIRCDYLMRASLLDLARQYARYGYPKVRVLRRHPRQMRPRQFVPAAFVLTLLLGVAGAPWSRGARLLLGLAAGAYVTVCLLVSGSIAARRGRRYLPWLPPAFAAMHLAYGAASLLGAFRFLLWPVLLRRPEPTRVPTIILGSTASLRTLDQ